MIKFNNPELDVLLDMGRLEDEKARKFIRGALNLDNKKVEATRHTILSGPPGVGKSYGTVDECVKNNVKYLLIAPGITDVVLATKLAVAVYNLKDNEELVVIFDDSDEVVFGDYKTLNKWKIAMGDTNYDLGIIPSYNHQVSMTTTISQLVKAGKFEVADAIRKFQSADEIGLSIPTDRVRFVVLCNLDLEDDKAYNSHKIRSAIKPTLDRFNYKRMNLSADYQWGWLAHVLSNTQPFDDYHLTDNQKSELLLWMRDNWDNLRNCSYRTVKRLAQSIINEPGSYRQSWNNEKKGN